MRSLLPPEEDLEGFAGLVTQAGAGRGERGHDGEGDAGGVEDSRGGGGMVEDGQK